MHVTWDPPASNGGSAITGYKIEAKTEDGTVAASQTCAASCTAADLPGLGDPGDYSFEVSAQNVQGYGPAGVLAPAATTDATGLEDFYPTPRLIWATGWPIPTWPQATWWCKTPTST